MGDCESYRRTPLLSLYPLLTQKLLWASRGCSWGEKNECEQEYEGTGTHLDNWNPQSKLEPTFVPQQLQPEYGVALQKKLVPLAVEEHAGRGPRLEELKKELEEPWV